MIHHICCFILCVGAGAEESALDLQDDRVQKSDLKIVGDRISKYLNDGSWRTAEWKDDLIEKWLQSLVTSLNKGVEDRKFEIPIHFQDTVPAGRQAQVLSKSRLVGRDIDVMLCRKSIVFAHGNIKVTGAEDSVLIGRGVVTIENAKRCVIVAGIQAVVAIDETNLVLSGGWACTDHSENSAIIAPEGVMCGHIQNGLLINSFPLLPPALLSDFRTATVPDVALDRMVPHAIVSRIKVEGIVFGAKPLQMHLRHRDEPIAVLFEFDDNLYASFLGKPLLDNGGQAIRGLRGWRVDYLGGAIVIFRNDDEYAVVSLAKK